MLHPSNIGDMEAAIGAAGVSVDRLCAEAGIDRSTWTRWKAKTFRPSFDKWEAVTEAYTRLTGENEGAA